MFFRTETLRYTESFSDKISRLADELRSADAVVIGAGAGLSTAAGFTYSGERFSKNFSDFIEKIRFQGYVFRRILSFPHS